MQRQTNSESPLAFVHLRNLSVIPYYLQDAIEEFISWVFLQLSLWLCFFLLPLWTPSPNVLAYIFTGPSPCSLPPSSAFWFQELSLSHLLGGIFLTSSLLTLLLRVIVKTSNVEILLAMLLKPLLQVFREDWFSPPDSSFFTLLLERLR